MARELTPQEQQMVFKELCIRAFYGVKVQTIDTWCGNLTHTLTGYREVAPKLYYFYTDEYGEYEPVYLNSGCHDKILPYLRSIDTMTEQEYESIKPMLEGCTHRISIDMNSPYFKVGFIKTYKPELLNWLYEHHFNIDLPKGLYVEMPKEMYVK